MTRDEKIALCRELKGEGWTCSEIAERTGIPRSTVGDYLLGREHVNAMQRARALPCSERGGPRYGTHPGVCAKCIREQADDRARRVVALWADGWELPEIAQELGISRGTLGGLMHLYRAQGYDLPYRYVTGKRAERRAARGQVAA